MRKERDVTLIDTLTLECLQLKMSPGFNLRKEDPQVYLNEDREGYNPKRQWPKIPLQGGHIPAKINQFSLFFPVLFLYHK